MTRPASAANASAGASRPARTYCPVGSGPFQSTSNGSPTTEAIPSSQRPSGGCSALSRKTCSTTAAIEEMPTSILQDLEIGPAGADVERFVDRQPWSIQRHHHRETRADRHRERESTGRSTLGSRPSRPSPGPGFHRGIVFFGASDRSVVTGSPPKLVSCESFGHPGELELSAEVSRSVAPAFLLWLR